MTAAVFPRECESVIDKEELKGRISIEDENHPQGQVIMGFLHRFIDEVSREAEGKWLPLLCLLFFLFLFQYIFSQCSTH